MALSTSTEQPGPAISLRSIIASVFLLGLVLLVTLVDGLEFRTVFTVIAGFSLVLIGWAFTSAARRSSEKQDGLGIAFALAGIIFLVRAFTLEPTLATTALIDLLLLSSLTALSIMAVRARRS